MINIFQTIAYLLPDHDTIRHWLKIKRGNENNDTIAGVSMQFPSRVSINLSKRDFLFTFIGLLVGSGTNGSWVGLLVGWSQVRWLARKTAPFRSNSRAKFHPSSTLTTSGSKLVVDVINQSTW